MIISFTLNGQDVEIDTPPHKRAANLLREDCQIKSIKLNCNGNLSGLCIIILNGRPVHSCSLPAFELRSGTVETLESISGKPELQDIQKGYEASHIQPCSSCYPARALITNELLYRNIRPTKDAALEAVTSVDCKCCPSRRLLDAILRTAKIREKRLHG